MAIGDFFQFAVAYPLKNPKFRIPTAFSGTVKQKAGNGEIVLNDDYDDVRRVLQRKDRCVVTDANGVGENLVIKAVNVQSPANIASIETDPITTLTLANGDKFRAGGTRLAGGWDLTASGNTRVVPLTTRPFGNGSFERYGQVFEQGTSQNDTKGVQQTLEKAALEAFAYYRFGMRYKFSVERKIGSNADLQWRINDSDGSVSTQVAANDVLSWADFASTFFVRSLGGAGALETGIDFNADIAGDRAKVWLDEMFFEHAKGTSPSYRVDGASNISGNQWDITIYGTVSGIAVNDEIAVDNGSIHAILTVTSASGSSIMANFVSGSTGALQAEAFLQKRNEGYFELKDWPNQDSLDISKSVSTRISGMGDGSRRGFNPESDGDKSEIYSFQCRFEAVDKVYYEGLLQLMRHQARGQLLNFHPFLNSLPSVMTGILQIPPGSVNHRRWSFEDVDFDLVFHETVI